MIRAALLTNPAIVRGLLFCGDQQEVSFMNEHSSVQPLLNVQ